MRNGVQPSKRTSRPDGLRKPRTDAWTMALATSLVRAGLQCVSERGLGHIFTCALLLRVHFAYIELGIKTRTFVSQLRSDGGRSGRARHYVAHDPRGVGAFAEALRQTANGLPSLHAGRGLRGGYV